MKRNILILLLLLIISFAVYILNVRYEDINLIKIVNTLFALTSIHFIRLVFEKVILAKVKESKTRYSFRKASALLSFILFLIILLAIWVEHPQSLAVGYGLFAAGVSIALQDLLKNIAGGMIIFINRIYRVGDRIEIDSKYGDVIDISVLYTTLMEIKQWVSGDQPTGRLTVVPNGYVLAGSINNYTKDYSFIWDEITIPFTYDSNWRKASAEIQKLVAEKTKPTMERAEKEMARAGDKYYYEDKAIEPEIFLSITDNWINFNIRYITDARERRTVNNILNQMILEMIESSKEYKIANESSDINITGAPEIRVREGK
ncbi:mechanosensitive ion channel family protein [Candidatus Omnitrophota bacterium]